jgi:hypothetical protein
VRNVREFSLQVSLSYCRGLEHTVKVLHGTDGFTSPPKEVVLRIFISIKNPPSSVGFEPTNLESSDKDANL